MLWLFALSVLSVKKSFADFFTSIPVMLKCTDRDIFEEKFGNICPFNIRGSYSSRLQAQINGMPHTFSRYTIQYGKQGVIADHRFCTWVSHRHNEIDNLYHNYFGILNHVHFVRCIDIMILLFNGYQQVPQHLKSYEGTMYFPKVNKPYYLKNFKYEEHIDDIVSPNGCAINYDGLLIGLYEIKEGNGTHRYWNHITPNFSNNKHRMDLVSFLLKEQYADLEWS